METIALITEHLNTAFNMTTLQCSDRN